MAGQKSKSKTKGRSVWLWSRARRVKDRVKRTKLNKELLDEAEALNAALFATQASQKEMMIEKEASDPVEHQSGNSLQHQASGLDQYEPHYEEREEVDDEEEEEEEKDQDQDQEDEDLEDEELEDEDQEDEAAHASLVLFARKFLFLGVILIFLFFSAPTGALLP